MAGRILKITLENTHPPIWRRVIVPDRITFRDLHEMIQILFGWEGYHLHCFENYTHGFMVDCLEDMESMSEIQEDKTLIDDYIEALPWIRYTYDFGDDWNHKIVYEKTDPSYNLRYATLLKYKGDNPMEDSGGVGPGMTFWEFDPIYASELLEKLVIPKRKKSGKTGGTGSKNRGEQYVENPMDVILANLIERARMEVPEFKDAEEDEILNNLMQNMLELAEREGLLNNGFTSSDLELERQVELLDSGKPFTVQQTRKKLQQHLSELNAQTIADYLKYSRIELGKNQNPAEVLADCFLNHTDILYAFFDRDEMKDLISFRNTYQSGQQTVRKEFLPTFAKCIFLGLIRLTGKRKLKLELCREFDEIINKIDASQIDAIYDQRAELVKTIGAILMAYVALSFDDFYQIYSGFHKKPMDRLSLEQFIYWNGTMNQEITTFFNSETGINYLMLPDMKPYLNQLESKITDYFRAAPRSISEIEFKKWKKGFNAAIPEWERYLDNVGAGQMLEEELVLAMYREIAGGTSMTELIMNDLQAINRYPGKPADPVEQLSLESDLWHLYAGLCLATPIIGLNGYSREQYAKEFQVSLDFVPLFDRETLAKRITKNTPLYQFPQEIQLEMIEALRRGDAVYERLISRLCQKYRSNQALTMEQSILTSEKVLEKDPWYEETMEDQKIFYPWSEEELNIPKPETYVRETKKIGRNDPCPCGSGRKYKQCCGKAKS